MLITELSGCAYLLSCWYPRFELQKRNAVFYLIGSMASAFSGIVAYGFYNMKGLGDLGPAYSQRVYSDTDPTAPPIILPGLAGWRWIVRRFMDFGFVRMLTCVTVHHARPSHYRRWPYWMLYNRRFPGKGSY